MERFMIISADCHAGLPTPLYRDYLESEYHDAFDEYLAARDGGEVSFEPTRLEAEAETPGRFGDDRPAFSMQTDRDVRLAQLESDGVTGEVIFPDNHGNEIPFTRQFGSAGGYARELHAAGQRAHNRWLVEFCDPTRQIGLAQIPCHDADLAVKEIMWAKEHGLRGLGFHGLDPELPPPYDDSWTPIWRACEETGLPVHYHAGTSRSMDPMLMSALMRDPSDKRTMIGSATTMMIALHEAQLPGHRSLWWLIYGGVFERHPELRVVFTEQFADWIPRSLRHMDFMYEHSRRAAKAREVIPLRPSEYWQRNCFVGASVMSRLEVEMRHDIGLDRMMFGTDFPHVESTWGHTTEYLRASFGWAGVPVEEAQAVLGDNAAHLYDLDLDLLYAIADRCGPPVDEALDPLDALELDDPVLREFVPRPEWPL